MELVHTPKVYLKKSGIYGYTKEIEYDADGNAVTAYLKVSAEVVNRTGKNVITEVEFSLRQDPGRGACTENASPLLSRSIRIQIPPNSEETASYTLTVDNPKLWDSEQPNLYRLSASARPLEEFRTHLIPLPEELQTVDCDSVLFGIRTIQADVRHGLRINGKSVKLRGG